MATNNRSQLNQYQSGVTGGHWTEELEQLCEHPQPWDGFTMCMVEAEGRRCTPPSSPCFLLQFAPLQPEPIDLHIAAQLCSRSHSRLRPLPAPPHARPCSQGLPSCSRPTWSWHNPPQCSRAHRTLRLLSALCQERHGLQCKCCGLCEAHIEKHGHRVRSQCAL